MRKNTLKICKRFATIFVIMMPVLILFVSCVNAIEKIDCFKSTTNIIIDGKWTTSTEWFDSSEESFIFVNGTGTAYLRFLNDDDYVYVLVDFITYNDTKTGDSCMVVFDTKNDEGTLIKSDDLAVLIRWNTPTQIYPAIQWGGWTGSWEYLPSDFEVGSSMDGENNLYSTDPHLIFEFKVPRDYFEPDILELGFISFLFIVNDDIMAGFPPIQPPHSPDDWYDLLLFNETIEIYNDAMASFDAASVSIENAESEGRTDGLSEAKSLINQAEDSMEAHDYKEVISLSSQALTIADEAIIPTQTPQDKKDTPGFEIIFVFCAIALVLFCKRKIKL